MANQPISATIRDADGTVQSHSARGRIEWLKIDLLSFLGEVLRVEAQARGPHVPCARIRQCEERIEYWTRKTGNTKKNLKYWRGQLAAARAEQEKDAVIVDIIIKPNPKIRVRINDVPVEWDEPAPASIKDRWATD